MKKKGFVLFLCLLISNINIHPAESQNKPNQEVTVTAVEVPVRVLRKNEIVKGLTKDDFEVFENGVKQDITTFEIVSRKIAGVPGMGLSAVPTKTKPRLFILIFDIFDYTDAMGEAIDYFFTNIFREQDHLAIVTESRLLNIQGVRSSGALARNLKETLKNYKIISTKNILKAYDDLQEESGRLLQELRGEGGTPSNWDQAIAQFYDNYTRIWRIYRSQFIMPDADLYQALLKRIQPIDAEKWAVCFQQRELFPEIKNEGPLEKEISKWKEGATDPIDQVKSRQIQSKQWQLQQEFDLAKNFPSDRLKNLFMESGITFHLILMKSLKTIVSEDFILREVTADYEACFKDISQSTGGYLTFSNKAQEALKEASEKEDYHYLLVYQPKGPLETRGKNIEVRVRKEGVDVYNLKQYMNLGGPVMTIVDVQAGRQTLKFSLKNYAMLKTGKGLQGTAEVSVTIFDGQFNKAFAEGKALDLVKDEIHIALNLGRLKPGSYFLLIEALDKITGEKDVYSRLIEL
jgi:hypothetical protein